MKAIYKFEGDCGRMGILYGLFVEEKEAVQQLIESKKEVHFGEVLGKHSDISGPIEPNGITMISDDAGLVAKFEELKINVGFNPVQIAAWRDQDGEE